MIPVFLASVDHKQNNDYSFPSLVLSRLLWDALAEATGQPIHDWMETWTLTEGFPVLAVDLSGGQSSTQQGSAVQQQVSVQQRPYSDDASPPPVWWIPAPYALPTVRQCSI